MKARFKLKTIDELRKARIPEKVIQNIPFYMFVNKEFIAKNFTDTYLHIVADSTRQEYKIPHNCCKYIRIEED